MNSGNVSQNDQSEQHDDKGGTDTGSWEHASGEGSGSALHRMKQLQRSRSEATPTDDEGPSSS